MTAAETIKFEKEEFKRRMVEAVKVFEKNTGLMVVGVQTSLVPYYVSPEETATRVDYVVVKTNADEV